MIHRQNWLHTKEFLRHLEKTRDISPLTLKRHQTNIRHLLAWADESPLSQSCYFDNPFPRYLVTARRDGKSVKLSYTTVKKVLFTARCFFYYAVEKWQEYSSIKNSWIESLYPSRLSKPTPTFKEHLYYTLEDVKKLISTPVTTKRESRAKIGVVILFLSGMRIDTLSSAPRRCIDIENNYIYQVPDMGVRTKNNKAGITHLLPIPELLDVVKEWDQMLTSLNFSSSALWYAPLKNEGEDFYEENYASPNRQVMIRKDIKLLCDKAGIKYLSPHKLRHGHIMYARSLALTREDEKAISQNVLHHSTEFTDAVYAKLKKNQVREIINNLGKLKRKEKVELLHLIEDIKSQIRLSI